MIRFILLVAIAFLSSCSQSLVYSPSVNLSHKPLREKEIDVQAGLESLPESRPEKLGGEQTTTGFCAQVNYGFSNRFNLALKGWADLEGRTFSIRSGYALSAQFIKELKDNDRLILLPRLGMALDGNNIAAYGLSTSVLYQKSLKRNLSYYVGTGLLWGFYDLQRVLTENQELRYPMGLGLLANLGLSWQLMDNFRLNLEVNPVYQLNSFDQNSQFIVAPALALSYTFRN